MADSSEKIRIYRQMLDLDPASRVFEFLAEELCGAGKWEEVAEVCRRGLRYHPEHLRPRVLFALALVELGDMEEAEATLNEIHNDIRHNSIIFKLMAEIAANSGDNHRAAGFLRIYEAFHRSDTPEEEMEEAPTAAPEPEAAAEAEPEPACPEEPALPVEAGPAERLEKILAALAQSLESRAPASQTPPALFTEADRDLLRNAILTETGL